MKRAGAAGFRDVAVAVMAGGFGTRFWPLSTPRRPKQFLTELAGESLYTQAVGRARRLVPPDRIVVVANQAHRRLVREQAPEVRPGNIICEPRRRDTAPALILAALFVERRWPGHILVNMPSDHLVTGRQAFRGAMAAAVAQARQGRLVTLGIPPTEPATRFGYLELADPPAALNPQRVRRFVEKPPPAKARHYAASGRHLWNSGIFIWRAARLLEEAARHLPETYRALAPLAAHFGRATFARKARRAFDRLTAVSIDYGIMERAEEVWVVPAAFPWSDLGGWRAAEALLRPDKSGNRCAGRVELDEVSGTLAVTSEGEAMLVAGVRDLVVVRGPGGVLVCHKSAADRLKPLVGRILGGP